MNKLPYWIIINKETEYPIYVDGEKPKRFDDFESAEQFVDLLDEQVQDDYKGAYLIVKVGGVYDEE